MYRGGTVYFYRLIPNFITILGLCFGMFAINLSLSGQWGVAMACVLVAGVMDMMDGMAARVLRANSTIGAQLDSLCDLINFGLAPSMIVYMWGLRDVRLFGWIFATIFVICMTLRLARFNATCIELSGAQVNARQRALQKMFFVGVPAPAGAILLMLPVMVSISVSSYDQRLQPVHMLLYSFLVSISLVSPLPTFSIKMLKIDRRYVPLVIMALFLFAICLITKPWVTVPISGAVYIMSIPCSIALKLYIEGTK